ncbi:hypothetical protein BV22DRAFT_1040986 [Leucogyrophana mollusca]|uniref:Uncharacterized protein n=1 Tax=Leucogyrophana mollusca TaxID=85980 RepID=A0ACB8B0Z3_9AGAM|nr:hypothetical protein BV22DRAFT_1040986 [Leucogyrophana mollusca]
MWNGSARAEISRLPHPEYFDAILAAHPHQTHPSSPPPPTRSTPTSLQCVPPGKTPGAGSSGASGFGCEIA